MSPQDNLDIEGWLKVRPEVIIDITSCGERHHWTIASFRERTGMKAVSFKKNKHTNEVI
jgi:hypothetical protein